MNTRQQTNYEPSESKPVSSERSAKLMILKTCQLLFSKDLSEPEINYWMSIMDSISVPAWRYAFENWQRNGRFFPKPKDVLEQVEAYKVGSTGTFLACGRNGCVDGWKTVTAPDEDRKVRRCECWDAFRNSGLSNRIQHYGEGYNTADIKWLMKAHAAKRTALNRTLKGAEVEALLDELDKRRGRSPVWRTA